MASSENKRRLVSTKGLMEYLSIGRNKAYALGREIGAYVPIGHTNLYDLNVVDAYIESERAKANTN